MTVACEFVGINQQSCGDRMYPIPKIKEMFASLAGGQEIFQIGFVTHLPTD